jgi:hypothetical protein
MVARLGKAIFWAALTVCGLVDFVTTLSFCVIVIGIGCATRCALAEPDYLSALFS